jgi:hypothetical protein
VITNDLGDSLADPGHESGTFEDAQSRIVLCINFFKLMVAIELDFPSEPG